MFRRICLTLLVLCGIAVPATAAACREEIALAPALADLRALYARIGSASQRSHRLALERLASDRRRALAESLGLSEVEIERRLANPGAAANAPSVSAPPVEIPRPIRWLLRNAGIDAGRIILVTENGHDFAPDRLFAACSEITPPDAPTFHVIVLGREVIHFSTNVSDPKYARRATAGKNWDAKQNFCVSIPTGDEANLFLLTSRAQMATAGTREGVHYAYQPTYVRRKMRCFTGVLAPL